MTAATIMVQGTGSSVGKSTLVTALCRIFMQDGLCVAPFKAQNMSNNAFVTPDALELGRSQAVQAAAAGVEPSSDMNPILLKPEGDGRSQVILNGKPAGSFKARSYYEGRERLWSEVTSALDRLRAQYDVICIEGAGSPAEVNLRDRDIVNMEIALYCQSPVLLAADIDRGGVFASLLGTLELLRPDERKLVHGLVINRFRGDRSLLEPLPSMIADRTGVPVLGVVPMIPDLQVQEEDGMSLERERRHASKGQLTAAVIRLPRISNFDDFDPFVRAGVSVRYAQDPADVSSAHIVLVPGTKHTIADLRWMKSRGLDAAIRDGARRGVTVLGICGGYQMLGEKLDDPYGVDGGEPDHEEGLGLLPVSTAFRRDKVTRRVRFRVIASDGAAGLKKNSTGVGYEIHTGETVVLRQGNVTPLLELDRGDGVSIPDGGVSAAGNVAGCYVHGLFDSPGVLEPLLRAVADKNDIEPPEVKPFSMDAEYDRLAGVVRSSLDMDAVYRMIGIR
ncbi:MAG: cobyric acid synthase [Chloroflexi bacterium]|nr:cobyric acid synthase [Chloroflexota bacterium]